MELDEFANVTRRVAKGGDLEGYMPTACFPERNHLAVLEGAPAAQPIEPIALDWAAGLAEGNEEYLVAYAVSSQQVKIVRRASGIHESRVYNLAGARG